MASAITDKILGRLLSKAREERESAFAKVMADFEEAERQRQKLKTHRPKFNGYAGRCPMGCKPRKQHYVFAR